ncbi:MAG TPA: tetratricopeptide repeat protein, partial [Chloroflexia bacterium]|nr:tetratricopeptide repeat protein [Chloroflexia bacterium]
WLRFLLRSTPQTRLLLIATYRPGEVAAGPPLAELLAAARRQEQLTELTLRPLDEAATAELAALAARRPLDAGVQSTLFRESEGNPLFVLELVRADLTAPPAPGAGALPPAVRAAIEARLAQLSIAAQDVVGLAATIGRGFSFAVLAAAAAEEERALIRALDELWQRRIVLEQGTDSYYFSHDKLREVAYARLSAAQRRLLHRQVARALESVQPAPDGTGAGAAADPAAGPIAAHWERAGEPGRAIPYYARAAAAARRLYANEAALDAYRRLLALLPAPEHGPVLLQQGQVWQLIGNWAEAEACFRAALASPAALADGRFAAQVQIELAGLLVQKSAYGEALTYLEQAQRTYEMVGDQAGLGQVLGNRGTIYYVQGDHDRALAYYEQWHQIATARDDRVAVSLATGRLALIYEGRADYAQAQACYAQQIALATALGDQPVLQRTLGNLGNLYKLQGDYSQALACYEQKLQIATAIGDRRSAGFATGSIGMVHQQLGDHGRALACFAEDLQISLAIGDRRNASFTVGNIGQIYAEQGAFGPALACALHVLQVALELGNRDIVPLALVEVARATAGRCAYTLAERLYSRTILLARALQFRRLLSEALLGLAEIWRIRGRPAAAAPLLDEALQISQQIGYSRVEFAARLAILQTQLVRAQITRPAAAATLTEMLQTWTHEPEQAALHYELWRLNPAANGHRQAAATRYQALYSRTPSHVYRQRYVELTGLSLPPAAPLPDLPPIVAGVPGDLAALLAQVDRIIAATPVAGRPATDHAPGAAPPSCPACGAAAVKKNGHSARGQQNYRCRACGRQFLPAAAPPPAAGRRAEVIAAVQAGMSLREAAQVFHVHRQTIARWVAPP